MYSLETGTWKMKNYRSIVLSQDLDSGLWTYAITAHYGSIYVHEAFYSTPWEAFGAGLHKYDELREEMRA